VIPPSGSSPKASPRRAVSPPWRDRSSGHCRGQPVVTALGQMARDVRFAPPDRAVVPAGGRWSEAGGETGLPAVSCHSLVIPLPAPAPAPAWRGRVAPPRLSLLVTTCSVMRVPRLSGAGAAESVLTREVQCLRPAGTRHPPTGGSSPDARRGRERLASLAPPPGPRSSIMLALSAPACVSSRAGGPQLTGGGETLTAAAN
jgi:hypothetical protein